MAERKQVNKYYPIDWSPSKGTVNKLTKSHPLRDRAKKLNEGILIIRFEMPFNIWCLGCNNHIAMGVRYNAQKTTIDSYYSTPIFQFKMKCHLCDNYIVLRSDPENCTYTVIKGAKRKEQRWQANENNQIEIESNKNRIIRSNNAMMLLEHKAKDKAKLHASLPKLAFLKYESDLKHKYDYIINQHLRSNLRESRNLTTLNSSSIKEKYGLDCEIIENELESDIKLAKMLNYSTKTSKKSKYKSVKQKLNNKYNKDLYSSLF